MKCLLSVLIFLSLLFIATGSVRAATYSGTYTTGLTVSGNGDIVDGANISNSTGGVCLNITGDNVIVRNSKIHDCQDHGVKFTGTNGGILENSEIWRAAMRYTPNSVGSGWASLVKVQSIDESPTGLAQNIIIRNNYIHEGYGECIGLRGSNVTVSGNHVKDCYSIGIYSNADHDIIDSNFVECTGNPEFNRSGQPMVGIGFAEESFANWGAHGHDSQKVLNNIVTGCKYGFRYGSSVNGLGLTNSIVAYNTFYKTISSAISITYYSNQANNLVENNIAASVSANSQGITIVGNVAHDFSAWKVPADFVLKAPLPAIGSYLVAKDYFGNARISPLDTGAVEYGGTLPNPTSSPSPGGKTGDVNGDGKVDIIDIGIIIDNYARSPIPNPKADINKDGKVDIIDIGILIDNYGK